MGLMAAPAWAVDLWIRAQPYLDRLAVWRGYEKELETLAILGIGIAIYTALVFAFYQNLSRRRPFHFRMSDRPGWTGRMGRFAERALVFPVTSFLYFAVLAVALVGMAKTQPVHQVLLYSMAVVVGVRVTVYLSETMSNDLSKLVPLSLLAIVLVDPGYIRLGEAWARLVEATSLWPLLGRYFLLFIALEAVMSSVRWGAMKVKAKWADLRIPQAKRAESPVTLHVHEAAAPPLAPKR